MEENFEQQGENSENGESIHSVSVNGSECSEWEEEDEEATPVPESLKRPGKPFLKSLSSKYLSEKEESEFRGLLETEGATPSVIQSIISVTNRFLNFREFYLSDYPKYQGFNRKVNLYYDTFSHSSC